MATYKVIQDIEAEDKLVGPLTLRQFIYGAIAALCAYLSFISITKNVIFLLVIFLPITLFTGFFAAPWGRDQPTEVWALAKIRFFLKPRRRIWDQSGIKELVDITVPKQIEKVYTNGLSQTEVQSRLTALANTLDSRGWAVKNVNTNLYDVGRTPVLPPSDRLIGPSSFPKEVPSVDITAGDDMLDEINNSTAQHLSQLVSQSSIVHRQQLVEQLKDTHTTKLAPRNPSQTQPPADYWFLNKPQQAAPTRGNNTTFEDSQVVIPGSENETGAQSTIPTQEEKALTKKLKEHRERAQQVVGYQHLKVIEPLGSHRSRHAARSDSHPHPVPVTPTRDPAKMVYVDNDDLSVATIERIVNQKDHQPDEVVVSFHNRSS